MIAEVTTLDGITSTITEPDHEAVERPGRLLYSVLRIERGL